MHKIILNDKKFLDLNVVEVSNYINSVACNGSEDWNFYVDIDESNPDRDLRYIFEFREEEVAIMFRLKFL